MRLCSEEEEGDLWKWEKGICAMERKSCVLFLMIFSLPSHLWRNAGGLAVKRFLEIHMSLFVQITTFSQDSHELIRANNHAYFWAMSSACLHS